jgi:hypothetical protein
MVIGSSAPPATPWTTRPAISGVSPSAKAVSAEPIANATRQAWSSVRRPNRSESWPSSGIAAT